MVCAKKRQKQISMKKIIPQILLEKENCRPSGRRRRKSPRKSQRNDIRYVMIERNIEERGLGD